MRRAVLLVTLVLVGFAVSERAARADCGQHQMLNDIAQLRALEALPLTLKNIGNPQNAVTWGDDADHPRRTAALNLPLVPCPEDSQDLSRAQRSLLDMWNGGLTFQNSIARLHFIKSGAILSPPACVAVYRASMRAGMINEWGRFVGRQIEYVDGSRLVFDAAPVLLYKQPSFGHVKALWMQNARQIGLRLPPLGFSNDMALSNALGKAAASASAHLPDDVHCDMSI